MNPHALTAARSICSNEAEIEETAASIEAIVSLTRAAAERQAFEALRMTAHLERGNRKLDELAMLIGGEA